MANPARRARPAHPLIGELIQAHRQRWTDAYQQNALSVLNRFHVWLTARDVELTQAQAADLNDYLDARRTAGITAGTVVKDHQFLTHLYGWLHAESELPGRNPMQRVARPKGANRVDPARIGYVVKADYQRLMDGFDMRRTLQCRDAAVCSLMYWSGVRRSEVVRIDRDRLDLDGGTLQVIGKNGEWDTVVLLEETITLISRYLRRRGPDQLAPLFVGTTGTTSHDGRMRPDAVSSMLQRRCAKLGINVTAHQFRRAMAINGKARGMNDSTMQHIGRWRDGRMVARYQRSAQAELSESEYRAGDPTARKIRSPRLKALPGGLKRS
jgi:site-specific recombinase XerD